MSLITFSVVIISFKSNAFFLLFPCRFHFGLLALCECRSCFRRPFSLPYLDNNIFDYFSGMEFNKLCLYVCFSHHPPLSLSPSLSPLANTTCCLPICSIYIRKQRTASNSTHNCDACIASNSFIERNIRTFRFLC